MTDGPTLRSLLERLSSVVPLGPRDYLAIERLLRSRESWAPDELRAAMASVLARSAEQWQRIAAIYDEVLKASELHEADPDGPPRADRPIRIRVAEPRKRPLRRLKDWLERTWSRFRDRLRNAPRWAWSLLVGFVVVLPLAVAVAWLAPFRPEPTSLKQGEGNVESIPPEVVEEEGVVLVPVDMDGDLDSKVTLEPPELDPAILLAMAALSMVALPLGVSWILLPRTARERQDAELEAQRALAEDRRKKLQDAKAMAGRALGVRYHVQLYLPVSRQAVLDSAEHLGRIFGESPGSDLDTEATLERTLAAAGRFEPVLEPRLLRHDVVLLIDTEEGSHPWLDAFLRLVDAWKAQGIVFRTYSFPGAPDLVVESETKRPLRLDELARQTEDLPLLIFSRQLDPAARQGEAAWLPVLASWSRRAWIDPDPRSRDELDRYRKQSIWKLERQGLLRFHLTDDGVVALARYLAKAEERPRPLSRDRPMAASPDPQQGLETPQGEALRLWALVAALVPDPTWDQLEAIRRHFPEIHRHLPEARYLQRLLEWVEKRTGQRAELDGGRGLAIPETQQDEWLRRQRRREKDDPSARGTLRRARQLLLQQLESTCPEDPADQETWRFKRSMHEAMLEPHRAAELLRWIGDSAIRHEALRWLKAELLRREDGFGESLPLGDREELSRLVGVGKQVPLWALVSVPWGRRSWGSWLAASLGAALAFYLASAFLGPLVAESFATTVETVIVERSAIYEMQERNRLPIMITLPGGSFLMGSDNSAVLDERPAHRVEIKAFQLSKTEVTVAQYAACVEAKVCEAPDTGSACNWNVVGRDNHPINCVSSRDAEQFAVWVGARLPTEAEWEYAARSGGLDRQFPWGEELPTCERVVFFEGMGSGSGCKGWGTAAVCSRPAGNTDQGVCDMAGNVWEYVEDDWHSSYSGAPKDGSAWIDEPRSYNRVTRGSSWGLGPWNLGVKNRSTLRSGYSQDNQGFRVARSL